MTPNETPSEAAAKNLAEARRRTREFLRSLDDEQLFLAVLQEAALLEEHAAQAFGHAESLRLARALAAERGIEFVEELPADARRVLDIVEGDDCGGVGGRDENETEDGR